jgi:hypothetical protein
MISIEELLDYKKVIYMKPIEMWNKKNEEEKKKMMPLNNKAVRELEMIAYEEACKCASVDEIQQKRQKAFDYINKLDGKDAYIKTAYIRKYIEMVNDYKHPYHGQE